MGLIYETSMLGIAVRVFSDRVEYKPSFVSAVESIPVNAIAGIRPGSFLQNKLVVETTAGRAYTLITSKKKEVADAIYQAQANLRAPVAVPAVPSVGVADELEKLARLRNSGVLSQVEFERQKSAVLGSPAPYPAPSYTSPAPNRAGGRSTASPVMRTLKRIGLGIVALFVLMIIIAVVAGPSKKQAAAAGGDRVTAVAGFTEYKIERRSHPKEKPTDEEFREVDVLLGHLPDRSDVLDSLMRSVLDAEIKKDDSIDILAMAFLGDEVVGDPKWSGSLVYRAAVKRVMTLDEEEGLKTERTDNGRFLLEVSEGKTAKGITPVNKWLDLTFVFSTRPTDAEIYKVVMDEAAKHRGIERHVFVYQGDKTNGMTWKQLDDRDGNAVVCTLTAAGKVTEASDLFATRSGGTRR